MSRIGTAAAALPAFLAAMAISASPGPAFTDFPHAESSGIVCYNCHDLLSIEPSRLPSWTRHEPQNIDDTQINTLCWSCHNDIVAPYASTHSSRTTSDKYGDADGDGEPGWSIECIDCHDPHFQAQTRTFGASTWAHQSTVTSFTDDTITSDGQGWADDRFLGLLVIPDIGEPEYNYRIAGNTADTLFLADPMVPGIIEAGDTLAVIYGKAIRPDILTPASGFRETRFFACSGSNSFADGDTVYDGVCEVCHTRTEHFRGDGAAPDQEHLSMGAVASTNCCVCHVHSGGFAHGGGMGGTGCDSCHGHDDGWGGGSYYGTVESHSTHTENDADDAMGPNIACADCHDTGAFPYFVSGTDTDGNGKYDLSETDVCDGCHSPGGTYDGVDDGVTGARVNWESGVYGGFALQGGKEKWCAGCHDEVPSVINGVTAPNVVGEESGTYTYGSGWGYYRTGHGLPATETYPASGGITSGAGVQCDGCHDFSSAHIDGLARTFDDGDSSATDPMHYRRGYRLSLVGGQEPMEIPWAPTYEGGSPNGSGAYRLCASCHAVGPFTDAGDMNTNFVSEAYDGIQNRHVFHVGGNNKRYPADWSGAVSSRMSCPSCHDVHGSTRLTMVRDGKLTGREPGQQIWYNNDDIVSYSTSNPDPPYPEDLPLSASTGVVWIGGSAGNLCTHCHANNNTIPEYRTPFQDVAFPPVLDWTGETGYETDGVYPDSGPASGPFEFRILYSDVNNDPPSVIQVWVDSNDDGDYLDTGERVDLAPVIPVDENYLDSKLYAASVPLAKAGDDSLSYRFYASDGADATGPPTADSAVNLLNSPPLLSWTGEPWFSGDGVDPDVGGDGSAYEFRISYRDDDDEAPSVIQVWIDRNDDGDYDDAGEAVDMAAAPGGNGDHTDGEIYRASMILSYAGDGGLDYRFYASDGTDAAAGDPGPVTGSTVIVSASPNSPPVLDWASADCLAEGVRPPSGADGADFEFMVRYTDPENQCPAPLGADIVVWIDGDDSGTYDGGEWHALDEADPADTDCSDGKVYALPVTMAAAGDGDLAYAFAATDGAADAVGTPVFDSIVTVLAAAKVRPSGGTGWETSIATAVNNNTGLILVYPDTGFTPAVYPQTFINFRHDRTLRSVCGPDLTAITGVDRSIMFQNSNNIEIDGFTMTGSINGVQLNGGNPVTIRNSRVHGNVTGILSAGANTVIEGCEIYSNGPAPNGGGIYINGGSHTITDTVIRDNLSSASGGGIFAQNSTSITIDGTAITGNTAANAGGVFIQTTTSADLRASVISGNTATGNGGGFSHQSSNVTLENCLVVDNEAGGRGGAVYVNNTPAGVPAVIVNTTFSGNRAGEFGGGYYLNAAEVIVRNSIFWNNQAALGGHNIYKTTNDPDPPGDKILTDSLISTGAGWISGGTWITADNLDPAPDPMFVGSGDYHLKGNSPAIDSADAAYAPDGDIDGDARPLGAADDMGADEYVP